MGSAARRDRSNSTQSDLEPGNGVTGLSGGAHPFSVKFGSNPGIAKDSYAEEGKQICCPIPLTGIELTQMASILVALARFNSVSESKCCNALIFDPIGRSVCKFESSHIEDI